MKRIQKRKKNKIAGKRKK